MVRSQGSIIVSVPNVAHWTVRWDLLWGRFDYQPVGIMDQTHLRWFTRKTLFAMCQTAGLTIIDYSVSAGTSLPDYRVRRVWRWIPKWRRDPMIRRLAKLFPTLFGCQHVVSLRAS